MSDGLTCHVCEQTVSDRRLLSDCTSCGRFYHLNPRNDVEGIDCGDVWTGGAEDPVLQFFCQPCIDGLQQQPAAQDAPATAGMPPLPPGMPPLPPGAPPEALAAMAQWAVPTDPGTGAAPSQPPPLEARPPRQRRRFRRIDAPEA